jgi:hypothetical protein
MKCLLFISALCSNFLKKQISGLDERPIYHPSENITIQQILDIYEKNKCLAFLESKSISIEEKIYQLGDKGVPKIYNVYNGGLLDDWNFEM